MIRVTDVHIEYSWDGYHNEAIKGVSLDINEKDYVAIVGPAGSGKSTLMAAIAGLLMPKSGDVFLGRYNMNRLSRAKRARARAEYFGIIFQFSDMINRFSVAENLQLAWQSRHGPRNPKDFARRRDYLVEELEIANLLQFRPSKLSGGQMQKAAIATALVKDAPVLLADEPSGDLDPHSLAKLKNVFKNEHKEGKTIVLITHDMKLAFDAKTIFELKDGVVTRVLK